MFTSKQLAFNLLNEITPLRVGERITGLLRLFLRSGQARAVPPLFLVCARELLERTATKMRQRASRALRFRAARTWRGRSPRGEAAAADGEGQQRGGERRIWIGRATWPHRLLLLLQKAPMAESSRHRTAAKTNRNGEPRRRPTEGAAPAPRPTTSGAERAIRRPKRPKEQR